MWMEADWETYAADGRHYPNDLTVKEWATIAPLLSVYDLLAANPRALMDTCLYLDKTGSFWRYLPKDSARGRRCGHGTTIYGVTGSGQESRV